MGRLYVKNEMNLIEAARRRYRQQLRVEIHRGEEKLVLPGHKQRAIEYRLIQAFRKKKINKEEYDILLNLSAPNA